MARYELYEIRSARSDEPEGDGDGMRLRRRSFVCAERPDLSLFAWLDDDDGLHGFQLLFREHVVGWRRGHGLDVALTNRHDINPFTEPDARGSRTLRDAEGGQAQSIVEAARKLIADAELPSVVDADVRAALASQR